MPTIVIVVVFFSESKAVGRPAGMLSCVTGLRRPQRECFTMAYDISKYYDNRDKSKLEDVNANV